MVKRYCELLLEDNSVNWIIWLIELFGEEKFNLLILGMYLVK